MGDIELQVFSDRLKILRNNLDITQKDFAEKIGITAAALSSYENNLKNPSIAVAKRIAETFNVSIDWLCGLSEQKELRPEIKNYKDIALKILELINLDMTPPKFLLTKYKVEVVLDENDFPPQIDYCYEEALQLPYKQELLNFFQTYRELNNLFNDSKIRQNVIDTWLNGALEELSMIPIKDNKPTQGNPLMSILKPDEPPQE